jgi:hypothetical protein
MTRIGVFVQENKTTDFYFLSMAACCADVRPYGSLLQAALNYDRPHDRNAWVHYSMGDYPAVQLSLDTDTVIPEELLASQDLHLSITISVPAPTPRPAICLTFAGQTPTFRDPPSAGRIRFGTCPRCSS